MDASASAPSQSGPAKTVPVVLTTSLSSLSIPSGPYIVPTDWRRTHLSTLVNKLLQSTSPHALADDDSNDGNATTSRSIPFDFIVDGQLLRASLEAYLESAGQTSESTLHIEYVRSTLPPTYVSAFEQDDWVASVDASNDGTFLTSSYDGSVRVFSAANASQAILTFSTIRVGSNNPSLTDARWVPSSSSFSGPASASTSRAIVTGGMDGVVRMWNVSLPSDPAIAALADGASSAAAGARPHKKWNGEFHTQPVSSLDVTAGTFSGTSHVMSAAWDGAIALWDDELVESADAEADASSEEEMEDDEQDDGEGADDADDPGAQRRKRRKLKAGAKKQAATRDRLRKEPVMTVWHTAPAASVALATAKNAAGIVPGTNARVSQALFAKKGAGAAAKDPNSGWSSGWDGSVKSWDFGVGGVNTSTKTSDKVILCMDQLAPLGGLGSAVLITGHMDRSAAIWDTRTDAVQVAQHLSQIHSGPVSAVRAHPTSSHLFSTASHDGTVKLWDSRSPKRSLFSLVRPAATGANGEARPAMLQDKVLALDWSNDGQVIVAGGQDKRITLHRGSGIGRED
ncbi:ribosome biogenesis protein ytm1 [Thecaphora frezii]